MQANIPIFSTVGYCGRISVSHLYGDLSWDFSLRFFCQMWLILINVFINVGEGRDGNRQTDTLERPPSPQRKQWKKSINLSFLYPSVFQISLSFEWLFSFIKKCHMHFVYFRNSDFMLKPTAKMTKKLGRDLQRDRNIFNICFPS